MSNSCLFGLLLMLVAFMGCDAGSEVAGPSTDEGVEAEVSAPDQETATSTLQVDKEPSSVQTAGEAQSAPILAEAKVRISEKLAEAIRSWPKNVVCLTSVSAPITQLKELRPEQIAIDGPEFVPLVQQILATSPSETALETSAVGVRLLDPGERTKVFEGDSGIRLLLTRAPDGQPMSVPNGTRVRFETER